MPASSRPSTPTMAASVRCAYFTVGSRNAPTPLLTASTPVIAVQPAANARSSSHSVIGAVAWEAAGRSAAGCGWPPLDNACHSAGRQDPHQRRDEQVGRHRQGEPRFLGAAQIDQRERHQDAQTKRQGVVVQRGHRRGERADAGGDADGDVQHVVHHQRRRGQQPGPLAQIVARHDVGPAIVRIGGDGLPVRGEQDQQQHQDDPGDRLHHAQPGRPAHRQHRQHGLRPVGRRAQTVQTHRRQPFERTDLAAFRLAVGQAAPEHETEQRHRR